MRTIPLWPIVDGRCGCGNAKCHAAGKHPDVSGVDRPGAGSGVETGGGLLVIDVDVKKENGFTSLKNYDLPDTYAVHTPTGGAHLYYSYDPKLWTMGLRQRMLPGVDIRADGGLVVGPGSPHVNGGVYKVAKSLPVAPAPKWLLELAQRPATTAEIPIPLALDDPNLAFHIKRCRTDLESFPPAVEGQGGDTQLFLAAQIPVRRYQLPHDVAEQLLLEVYNPRCQPPWEDVGRIRHKIQEAASRGSAVIGTHDWLQKLVNSASEVSGDDGSFVLGQPSPANKGKISPANVLNIFMTHESWQGVWRFDEFRGRVVAHKPPVRLNASTKGLTESDYSRIANWFEIHGYLVSSMCVAEQIVVAAEANPFHPVRDYLNALPAPATRHLDQLAETIYGDTGLWAQLFLKHTLVSAVRRIFSPGLKFDYVPVLYGGQGEGKSKSISALFGREFTSEQFPDLSDMVRACMDIQGNWVVEAAELHSIRSHAAVEAAKAFISRGVDFFTPKYGRTPISLPRQCIFIGTTNEDDFLRDTTGNRRYWPIRVLKPVDHAWITQHRDEIWAEAVALAKTNYRAHFTLDEDKIIDAEVRGNHEQTDAWFPRVRDYCIGRAFVAISEIYHSSIDTSPDATSRYDNRKQDRIAGCLRQLGCHRVTKWHKGKTTKLWVVPDAVATAEASPEEAERRQLAAVRASIKN